VYDPRTQRIITGADGRSKIVDLSEIEEAHPSKRQKMIESFSSVVNSGNEMRSAAPVPEFLTRSHVTGEKTSLTMMKEHNSEEDQRVKEDKAKKAKVEAEAAEMKVS